MKFLKSLFHTEVKYKRLAVWDHSSNSENISEHIEMFRIENYGKRDESLVEYEWIYKNYKVEFSFKNLILFRDVKNDILIWFYGLRDFKNEIYAKKLLACINELPASSIPYHLKAGSINIQPESLKTVKAILDDELITPLSKLAAIISYSKTFSSLSTGLVLSIAHQQTPADLIKSKNFVIFENFLRPDFTSELTDSSYRRNRRAGDSRGWSKMLWIHDATYKLALDLSSFVLLDGDSEETFHEYRSTVKSDGFFVSKDPNMIFQEVILLMNSLKDPKVFDELNRSKVLFLINFCDPKMRSKYPEYVLRLYRPGVSENILEFLKEDNHYYFTTLFSEGDRGDDYSFKSLLNKNELELVAEIFNDAFGNLHKVPFLYKRNVLYIVDIFLNFGENAVREVSQYFKREVIEEPQNRRTVIRDVEATPEMQKFLDESIHKLHDPKYADYPISWLLEVEDY